MSKKNSIKAAYAIYKQEQLASFCKTMHLDINDADLDEEEDIPSADFIAGYYAAITKKQFSKEG